MLREVRRVLKPGGVLHVLDLAGPEAGTRGSVARWLHSRAHLRDNAETRMSQAGLPNPKKVAQGAMLGRVRINYHEASAPAG